MNIYNVTIFGLHLKINPVAFVLPIGGGWEIRWYGIIIAVGFLLALLYAFKYSNRYNINLDRALDVVIVTVPLAILGARTYYLIFDGEKLESISDFFGGGGGGFTGLAIYGGVIVAFTVGPLMCLVKKIYIPDMVDIAAVGFLIGQGVGRWGNFMNQEAFGGPTGSKFFGMTSENVVYDFSQNGFDSGALAHPCFLYESIWCIAGFFILNHFSKKRKFSGQIALMYGVWYGFGRAIIETLRTDSLMIGNLKVSSIVSIVLCLICGVLLVVNLRKVNETKYDDTYQLMVEETGEQEIIAEEENEQDY